MPDMPNDWTNCVHYSIDPLRDVAPSLLNSSDIVRYAKRGCLVHPFDPGPDFERLNPASYTIRLLGTLHSWEQGDRSRRQCTRPIKAGDRVDIPANSITYLETKDVFRLPQYVAARFNLHIRYVHMGILLGTGPLVDPGFVGPLLIPLHNLTDNDYRVEGGDNLLWVEFTKLTTHKHWHRPLARLDDRPPHDLIPFRARKRHLDARSYLQKAEVWNRGVISAFKGALADSRNQARVSSLASQAARREALAAATKVERITLVGTLGLGAAIVALLIAAWQLWQGNSEMASRIHDRLDRIERVTGLLPAVPVPSSAAGSREDVAGAPAGRQDGVDDADFAPEQEPVGVGSEAQVDASSDE